MIEDIFKSGRLELPTVPVDSGSLPLWGDLLANRILVGVAVFLFLISLPDLVRLFPLLLDCYSRVKGNNDLEHSLSTARDRTGCALALAIPFCLMADRYQMYRPAFWQHIPDAWSAPATIGVLLAFVIVRGIFFLFFKPKGRQEQTETVHHVAFNYFILLTILMLLTVGIFALFKIDSAACGKVLLWETAVVYVLSFSRTGQILGQFCYGFSTFLYLCALEVIPVAILVASAVLL